MEEKFIYATKWRCWNYIEEVTRLMKLWINDTPLRKVSLKAVHGILSLIHFLLQFISINHLSAKEVAFADDFTVTGKLTSIKDYWGKLTVLCPKYGYFPKGSKSYLIVKEHKLGEARNVFNDSNVYITIGGKRHLGAVIGSNEY